MSSVGGRVDHDDGGDGGGVSSGGRSPPPTMAAGCTHGGHCTRTHRSGGTDAAIAARTCLLPSTPPTHPLTHPSRTLDESWEGGPPPRAPTHPSGARNATVFRRAYLSRAPIMRGGRIWADDLSARTLLYYIPNNPPFPFLPCTQIYPSSRSLGLPTSTPPPPGFYSTSRACESLKIRRAVKSVYNIVCSIFIEICYFSNLLLLSERCTFEQKNFFFFSCEEKSGM